MNRRTFLYRSALAGGAWAFQGLIARSTLSSSGSGNLFAVKGNGGYGPLNPAKTQNTGEVLLALPEGFRYTVIGKAGAAMADNNPTPIKHDGMAAFKARDGIRLVRNHEINNRYGSGPIAFGDKAQAYDTQAGGGTTTLVIDPKTRLVIKDFVSLSGTLQNCAGGPTPWGSWITCEETVLGRRAFTDSSGKKNGGFEQSHGYCFEVSCLSNAQSTPVPLKQMGRFVHEAIAVDPSTGIVYETEDQGTAGFYRFIPNKKNKLAAGGILQMLAIKDQPKYDTRSGQRPGIQLPVVWVDIADPDPAEAETNSLAVYQQGVTNGGATFARLEGCWYGKGRIFFTSTSGGDQRLGQVWEYRPKGDSGGDLTLLFESPSAQVLDGPDNICVSPRGGLLICEDGKFDQYLRGLTRQGQVFDFAKNMVQGYEQMEFAGATFGPDGETLFVNIQTPGLTFAIWGPWADGAL